jgi:hypothetical protein
MNLGSAGLQVGLVLSIGSYVLVSWLGPMLRKSNSKRSIREEDHDSKSA